MLNVLIGTDPELFLKDQTGAYVSAHDLIPGSKILPHRVQSGAIQPDGVAAEFNTNPAATADEFLANIDQVIEQLQDTFKRIRPDLTIAITPTATFEREYFDGLPQIATVLGCTPDYNAYTGGENDPPSTDEPFRTGSGHIHVGWGRGFKPHNEEHFSKCRLMVKQLDTVLYVSSLLWDADDKRRTLYGKIGAFRPKNYGVEYRPLSNSYLQSKEIQRTVFDITKRCSELFLNEGVALFEDTYAQEMVNKILNGKTPGVHDIDEYLRYMADRYKTPLVTV